MFNKTTKIQLKQTQLFRFKILIKELDLLIQYIDQTRQGCLICCKPFLIELWHWKKYNNLQLTFLHQPNLKQSWDPKFSFEF